MKLFLKSTLFTVVMPGTFAVLLTILLAGDRTAARGATLGWALFLFALGSSLYLRSAWDFGRLWEGEPQHQSTRRNGSSSAVSIATHETQCS